MVKLKLWILLCCSIFCLIFQSFAESPPLSNPHPETIGDFYEGDIVLRQNDPEIEFNGITEEQLKWPKASQFVIVPYVIGPEFSELESEWFPRKFISQVCFLPFRFNSESADSICSLCTWTIFLHTFCLSNQWNWLYQLQEHTGRMLQLCWQSWKRSRHFNNDFKWQRRHMSDQRHYNAWK